MIYHKICARCGSAFSAQCHTAKYCESCRPAIQREHNARHLAKRRAFTARAIAISGRVEFNGFGKGRRAKA